MNVTVTNGATNDDAKWDSELGMFIEMVSIGQLDNNLKLIDSPIGIMRPHYQCVPSAFGSVMRQLAMVASAAETYWTLAMAADSGPSRMMNATGH